MSVENYLNSLLKERYGEGARYKRGKVLLPDGSVHDIPTGLRKLAIEVEEERRFGFERFRDRALKNLFVLLRLEGVKISWRDFIGLYGNLPTAKLYEDFQELVNIKEHLKTKLEYLCMKKLKDYYVNLGKYIESVVEKSYEKNRLKELLREINKLEKQPDRSIGVEFLSDSPSELYFSELSLAGERLVLR
jgi:hypothetical protein